LLNQLWRKYVTFRDRIYGSDYQTTFTFELKKCCVALRSIELDLMQCQSVVLPTKPSKQFTNTVHTSHDSRINSCHKSYSKYCTRYKFLSGSNQGFPAHRHLTYSYSGYTVDETSFVTRTKGHL
jgi:hypothetical protein